VDLLKLPDKAQVNSPTNNQTTHELGQQTAADLPHSSSHEPLCRLQHCYEGKSDPTKAEE